LRNAVQNIKDLFVSTSQKGLSDFATRVSNRPDIAYANGRKIIENVYIENDPAMTKRK
jgi:hypothetical protein